MCLGSEVDCSGTAGSLTGCWGLVFLMGIGCGRTCLGKPLKNQAPERFHTLGRRGRGWWHGSQALLLLPSWCQFLTLLPSLSDWHYTQHAFLTSMQLFTISIWFTQYSWPLNKESLSKSFSWWRKLNITKVWASIRFCRQKVQGQRLDTKSSNS